MFAQVNKNPRMRSQSVDVNVRWSGGYAGHSRAQGHGFEPHRGRLNFLPLLSLGGRGFNTRWSQKKSSNFSFFAYVHAWPETP